MTTFDFLIDEGLLVDRPHLADVVARLGGEQIVAALEVWLAWAALADSLDDTQGGDQ